MVTRTLSSVGHSRATSLQSDLRGLRVRGELLPSGTAYLQPNRKEAGDEQSHCGDYGVSRRIYDFGAKSIPAHAQWTTLETCSMSGVLILIPAPAARRNGQRAIMKTTTVKGNHGALDTVVGIGREPQPAG